MEGGDEVRTVGMAKPPVGDDDPSPLPRRKCTHPLTQNLYATLLFMLFPHTKNPPFRVQIWT